LKTAAVLGIRMYRVFLSPFTMSSCRYYPTCSHYGEEAIRKYGALRGAWLTVRRLVHCNPWGGSGLDPVP
jgi:putative membrane protein insertion efficiency factor